jgi:hypothetical protein
MLLDLLEPEDQSLLEGMCEGLGQGERDRLLQEAAAPPDPELAGEDPDSIMQELLLRRSCGPTWLRKCRERLEAQAGRQGPSAGLGAGSAGDSRDKSRRSRVGASRRTCTGSK